MKGTHLKVATALTLLMVGSTQYSAYATQQLDVSTVNTGEEVATVSNSYFTFKNIWGGTALKIEFDQSTMTINALAQSGNFSNATDNFNFKLIDGKTNEVLIDETASTRYVNDFVEKINEKAFNYGDTIALNINSESGLGNPVLNSDGQNISTSCVGITQYFVITEAGVVKYDPELNAENPYFMFKNAWGGDALKVLFDKNTMKIYGISKSGNFSDNTDNLTLNLIDGQTKETLFFAAADQVNVSNFVSKIHHQSFKYGDIIALNVSASSGVKNPTVHSDGTSVATNCVGETKYFVITESGIEQYEANIVVDGLKILGEGVVSKATLTGKTDPLTTVVVTVEGKEFVTTSDSSGYFVVDIELASGFVASTEISVYTGEIGVKVYPQLSENKNLAQSTVTGYSYILNADLDVLTEPFAGEIIYGRTLLSEEGQKAWDIAYRTLLKYDNSDDQYPRDSQGNTRVYIDYISHGIEITAEEAQYIQKYLVRNCPRMFLLKDWSASPVYENGKLVGQNFYIGNNAQNGNDYQNQLMETEEKVSYILSHITSDMSVYQIIRAIQENYVEMMGYRSDATYNSDIRGPFTGDSLAICGGYAKGLEYLLQRVGIENVWISGYAGGYHAWNHINVYGNWYLSDATWGAQNWYLKGSSELGSHNPYETYHVTPVINEVGVAWGLGDKNQTIANLTGIVSYEQNSNGTITVTYEDKENLNETMHINASLNDWEAVEMQKDKNGTWSVVLQPITQEVETINFFFTVNEKYQTAGNLQANQLDVIILPNGMHNVEVKVDFKENVAPTITGAEDVTIFVNESFDLMAGVTAEDIEDGDLTDQIMVDGAVDTTTVGIYPLVYTVEDSQGARTVVERQVTVIIERSELQSLIVQIDEIIESGRGDIDELIWDNMLDNRMWAEEMVADVTLNQIELNSISYHLKADINVISQKREVTKQLLLDAINQVESLDESQYTTESWGVLKTELEVAKGLYELPLTQQSKEVIDQAILNITTAINQLSGKDTTPTYDLTPLLEAMQRADELIQAGQGNIPDYAWEALLDDRQWAEEVYCDPNVTQQDINSILMWLLIDIADVEEFLKDNTEI